MGTSESTLGDQDAREQRLRWRHLPPRPPWPRLQLDPGAGGASGRCRLATRARSYGEYEESSQWECAAAVLWANRGACRGLAGLALAPGIWSCQREGLLSGGCRAGKATGRRGRGSRARAAFSRRAGRAQGGSRVRQGAGAGASMGRAWRRAEQRGAVRLGRV